jgi:hypothetical protein
MTLSSEARRVNFISGTTAGARMHMSFSFLKRKNVYLVYQPMRYYA